MKKSANSGPLKARLATWIAMGGSIAAFARDNPGTSLPTFKRWAADPAFQADVRRQCSAMLEDIRRRMMGSALKASDKLFKLLDNPNASIQLGAAKAILDKLLDVNDAADVDRRLADLEERAARAEKH